MSKINQEIRCTALYRSVSKIDQVLVFSLVNQSSQSVSKIDQVLKLVLARSVRKIDQVFGVSKIDQVLKISLANWFGLFVVKLIKFLACSKFDQVLNFSLVNRSGQSVSKIDQVSSSIWESLWASFGLDLLNYKRCCYFFFKMKMDRGLSDPSRFELKISVRKFDQVLGVKRWS